MYVNRREHPNRCCTGEREAIERICLGSGFCWAGAVLLRAVPTLWMDAAQSRAVKAKLAGELLAELS